LDHREVTKASLGRGEVDGVGGLAKGDVSIFAVRVGIGGRGDKGGRLGVG